MEGIGTGFYEEAKIRDRHSVFRDVIEKAISMKVMIKSEGTSLCRDRCTLRSIL
jgi:hypothetical protein